MARRLVVGEESTLSWFQTCLLCLFFFSSSFLLFIFFVFFSHVCHGPCIPRRVPSNRQKQGGWIVGLNEVMKLPTIVCRRVACAGLEADVQRSNDHHLERIKMASLLQTTMLFCWSARISLYFFLFLSLLELLCAYMRGVWIILHTFFRISHSCCNLSNHLVCSVQYFYPVWRCWKCTFVSGHSTSCVWVVTVRLAVVPLPLETYKTDWMVCIELHCIVSSGSYSL